MTWSHVMRVIAAVDRQRLVGIDLFGLDLVSRRRAAAAVDAREERRQILARMESRLSVDLDAGRFMNGTRSR